MSTVTEALLSLHLEQFSGKVILHKDQVTKTIFFRKGNPIYVDSSVRSETLGQILLEKGRLTQEQYRTVIQKMDETRQRQGEIIVQLGFLSGYEVYEALREQGARKVQNCFLLEGAEIEAHEGETHLQNVPELPIEFFRVYVDTVYSIFVAQEKMNFPEKKALQLTPKAQEYLCKQSLTAQETRVVRMLDGKNNEAFVYARLGRDLGEPFLVVLHSMNFLQLVPLPPQRFQIPASQVAKPKPEESPADTGQEGRSRVVEIKDDTPHESSSPIYSFALRLNRPPHELLGIKPQTNKFEIKRHYDALVRKLHLDKIAQNYSAKDAPIAEKVFDSLTLALTMLSDDRRRHAYFSNLSQQKEAPQNPPPEITAESCVQKARVYAAGKDFEKGEAEIRKAVELVPKESAYLVELATLLLQKSTARKEPLSPDVETLLKEALKLNSTDADAHYELGAYYKLQGDQEKARQSFQRAVDSRPGHGKALSELRLLNLREDGRKSESPLLKFFKRK